MKNQIYNRELNWTELVATAMHIFAATFGSFVKVLMFIFLPISLLEGVILGRMTATSAAIDGISQMASPSNANIQEMMGLFMQMMTQEFLLYAVAMFLQPVGTIAIAKMVKQFIDGEKIEAGKAISEALNHMPAILITGFIYGALVLLGSFVIIPGVYFGIAWGLYAFCIAFEDKKGWDALRGSKALVQGKWWRTLGYLFLLSCVSMLWNSVFQLICSFFGESTMANVMYQFLCYISVGFVAVGECLLYLNRKAVADGACVFGTAFVDDVASAKEMPAEPVEGTVDGAAEDETEEGVGLLENKEENENK
ncbi:MAG: hypothetical protein IJY76_07610 [Anaerotignum sp.]|nr:hypothetical protein [Anaerotignum sp.]